MPEKSSTVETEACRVELDTDPETGRVVVLRGDCPPHLFEKFKSRIAEKKALDFESVDLDEVGEVDVKSDEEGNEDTDG